MSTLSEQQIGKIVTLAQERCLDSDFGHTMEHINLTVEISKYLAAREKADEEVCIIAAYLHDIAKNNSQSHGLQGAREAEEFLRGIGAPDRLTEEVGYAISQHDNDLPKKTIEAEILWDADKLQSVGPLGFIRIFGSRLISGNKDIYYAIKQAKYWEQFFAERFYTDTARAMTMPLHHFMQEFFCLYDSVVQAQLDNVPGANHKPGKNKREESPELTEHQMAEVVRYSRERHSSSDFHHGTDHVELTVKLAQYLADKESANREICLVAAYLHDIAKTRGKPMAKGSFKDLGGRPDGHGKLGAEEARAFLKKLGISDTFAEQVHYAISQHDNDLPKTTIEARVLWDADKLQLIGPFGFARIIQYYLTYLHQDIYYAMEQAKSWQQFFLERFCTGTGQAIAERLHRFMMQFSCLCDTVRNAQLGQILQTASHVLR